MGKTHITNRYNLPEALVNAAKVNMPRVAGDLSTSQLVDSVQIRMLKRTTDIEVDVTDRINSMIGTALHLVIQKANISEHNRATLRDSVNILKISNQKNNDPNIAKAISWLEKKTDELFPEKEQDAMHEFILHWNVDGTVVYGSGDLYVKSEKKLYDFKFCSVYDWILPENKKKWEAELNVFAFLLRMNGFPVDEIEATMLFKDYSRTKAQVEKIYPPASSISVKIRLANLDEMSAYMSARVKAHRQGEEGNIPECSGGEKWSKATTYALMQPGGARSLGNHTNKAEAYKDFEKKKGRYPGLYVETRLGENVRCAKWCPVRDVCPQRKRELKQSV